MRSQDGRCTIYCDFDQLDAATRAVDVYQQYFDRVAQVLGHSHDGDVEIWLDSGLSTIDSGLPVDALTNERRIIFNPSGSKLEGTDLILCHEFVHWHIAGSVLERNLPYTLQEGLCGWIAADLTVRWMDGRQRQVAAGILAASERGTLPTAIARLDLPREPWQALPLSDVRDLYDLGFVLVDLIGVEPLCRAAEAGPLSGEEILAMAGIGLDGEGLVITGHLLNLCLDVEFFGQDGTTLSTTHAVLGDDRGDCANVRIPPDSVRLAARIVDCPEASPTPPGDGGPHPDMEP